MAARRERGVWVDGSDNPSTIVVNADGTAIGAGAAPSTATVRTLAHTAATASNVSSDMLALNAARKYALIQNDGSVVVYLKFGAVAVANQGIRLEANGGSYELGEAFGNLDTRVVRGITVSGSANVMVTEG